jgi:CheY-like chemotaxis protein
MDLTIPGGMGGQEAVALVRQADPDAKVVVASGYSTDPVLAHYRDYGFSAAIAKPFQLNELLKTIKDLL